MTADFSHTNVARDNRHRKALRLRAFLILFGVDVEAGFAATSPDAGPAGAELRRRVRKAAGYDREPSAETWQQALVELERRPPAIVAEADRDRQAPCGCWPARDTGVLYESPPTPLGPTGWPCQHHVSFDAILCTRGGAVTAEAAAAVQDFGRELARQADEAALAPGDDVLEPDQPWWA